MYYAGLDISGSSLTGVIVDLSCDPAAPAFIKAQHRAALNPNETDANILAAAEGGIRELSTAANVVPAGLGLAVTGIVGDRILLSRLTHLIGTAPHLKLAKRLNIPASLWNDGDCFTYAEARAGSARGARNVVGITIGSGIGGGVVINSELYRGRNLIAGEWGHIALEPSGSVCHCGQLGCAKMLLSGPALEEFYKERSGRRLGLAAILSQENDPAAAATLLRLNQLLTQLVGIVVRVIDPEVVVLGGGVAKIPGLAEQVSRSLKILFSGVPVDTKIVGCQFGDFAAAIGAALVAHDQR